MHISRLLKKFGVVTPYLVVVAGICLSFVAWRWTSQSVESKLEAQFDRSTNEMTSLIQDRMDLYTNVLYGAEGFFAGSQSVQVNEWASYVQQLDIPDNYAGISSMFYIERVPVSVASSFPYPIYPQSNKPEYYPYAYRVSTTATSTVSSTALGFDTSSDPARWAALLQAEDTDQLTATPIILGITSKTPLLSVYGPIYQNGSSIATVPEREQALVGFVGASFRVSSLFAGLTSDPVFDKNIDVAIYDAVNEQAVSSSTLLFETSNAGINGQLASNVPAEMTNVTVGGRTWTLVFKALSGYSSPTGNSDAYAPEFVLAIGVILSILLGWLIYAYAGSRERAIALAEKMTKDLELSRRGLKEYIDQMSTFNAKLDTTGKFLLFNRPAAAAIGASDDQIYRMNFLTGSWWLDEPTKSRVKDAFEKAIATGKAAVLDEQVKIAGGKTLYLNISIVPVLDEKRVIQYLVAEGRDITDMKIAEETLQARTLESERLNALMIGRELKMTELKQEIERLTKKDDKKE